MLITANYQKMRPYHAHIYFNETDIQKAVEVRDAIAQAIPNLSYLGRLINLLVGPHPKPMFELHIPPAILDDAVLSIDGLRDGLSVLIHPVQDNELEAHTTKARWLGTPLPLKLSVFDQR
jgi:aromatic ring-cleaving dioxygenase